MTVRDPDATGFEPSLRVVAGDPYGSGDARAGGSQVDPGSTPAPLAVRTARHRGDAPRHSAPPTKAELLDEPREECELG